LKVSKKSNWDFGNEKQNNQIRNSSEIAPWPWIKLKTEYQAWRQANEDREHANEEYANQDGGKNLKKYEWNIQVHWDTSLETQIYELWAKQEKKCKL
jgi:hypothetical protein